MQPDAFQLGDFVQLMPTIIALARQRDCRVPVHFETPKMGRIFGRSPFIRLVRARPRAAINFFGLPGLSGPRYRQHFEWARRLLGLRGRIPWPVLPDVGRTRFSRLPGRRYCAVIRGSRSRRWHHLKDPGDRIYRAIYQRLLARHIIPVFLGGEDDERWWFGRMNTWGVEHIYAVNRSLEETLAILRSCDAAVANDTGLAQVAAAYRLPTFILWKKTPISWQPPQPWVQAALQPAWTTEFAEWLERRL